MEILNELRKATAALHARIEELPMSRAMLAGTVDRTAYARLLADLYHVHAVYESALAGCAEVAACWPATPSRAAAIRRDLAVLGGTIGPMPDWVGHWQAAVEGAGHPAAWAGVGYVVEGSRLGSRLLARSLAAAFGRPPVLGVGLDYHLDAGDDPAANWRQVLTALATLDRGPVAREAILAAAVVTFETLYDRYESVGCPGAALAATP